MEEIITSRFNRELVKKIDEAVKRGHFRSRSEALRVMTEEYLQEHPDLLIGDGAKKLIEKAQNISNDELEAIGSSLFRDGVARLVAEGRQRT